MGEWELEEGSGEGRVWVARERGVRGPPASHYGDRLLVAVGLRSKGSAGVMAVMSVNLEPETKARLALLARECKTTMGQLMKAGLALLYAWQKGYVAINPLTPEGAAVAEELRRWRFILKGER